MANLGLWTMINRATAANIQLCSWAYFSTKKTHFMSSQCHSVTDHYRLSKVLWSSKPFTTIIQWQVSLKVNFSCQWWRAYRWEESNGRRMPQNKMQDWGGLHDYFHHISYVAFLKFFLLFSFCFGTNKLMPHEAQHSINRVIIKSILPGGWAFRNTIDYCVIHQRNCKPLRGSAQYKPSFREKLKWSK